MSEITVDPDVPGFNAGNIATLFVDVLRSAGQGGTIGISVALFDAVRNIRETGSLKEPSAEQRAWLFWVEVSLRYLTAICDEARNDTPTRRVPNPNKSEIDGILAGMRKHSKSVKLRSKDLIDPTDSDLFEFIRQEISNRAKALNISKEVGNAVLMSELYEVSWREAWSDSEQHYEVVEKKFGRAYMKTTERHSAFQEYKKLMLDSASSSTENYKLAKKALKLDDDIVVVRGIADTGKTCIAKQLCGEWIHHRLAAAAYISLAGLPRSQEPLEDIEIRLRSNIGPVLSRAINDGVWSLGARASIIFCDDLDRMEGEDAPDAFVEAIKRRLEHGPLEIGGKRVRLVLIGRPSIADRTREQLRAKELEFVRERLSPNRLHSIVISEFNRSPRFASRLNDKSSETVALLKAVALGGQTTPNAAEAILAAMGEKGPCENTKTTLETMIDRLPLISLQGDACAVEPKEFREEIAADAFLKTIEHIVKLPDGPRRDSLAAMADYADARLPDHFERLILKKTRSKTEVDEFRRNLLDKLIPRFRSLLDVTVREGCAASGQWDRERLASAECLLFKTLNACYRYIRSSRHLKSPPPFNPHWPDKEALRRILRRSREFENEVYRYLSDLDISGQSLSATDLTQANFRGSVARDTDFSGAWFGPGTTFEGATLDEATFDTPELVEDMKKAKTFGAGKVMDAIAESMNANSHMDP